MVKAIAVSSWMNRTVAMIEGVTSPGGGATNGSWMYSQVMVSTTMLSTIVQCARRTGSSQT